MQEKTELYETEQLQNAAKQIKLVMADVDGTLLTSDQVVDEQTIQAIADLRKNGILFGLCTGRETQSVLDALPAWGIDGLVDAIVGSGGSEIMDLKLKKRVQQYPLSGALIHKIMKHYEDMPVSFAIPENGLLYSFADDQRIRDLSKGDRIPYEVVDADEFLKVNHPKVMLTFKPETMDAVKERSLTFSDPEFTGAPLVTASVLFEYMDPRVSKPAGLKELLNWHGWSEENLCSFGDEDNDYAMTKMAGLGVVMGNGSAKTKSAANAITDDNNHAGIAKFIEAYLVPAK